MSKTNVICILPIRNEAWILKNFIEAAKEWADFIIIGDHNSTDGSVEIAQNYDFVKVIPLKNPAFDAGVRRKILINEARKIPGKRLIFAIDADEMISANWVNSPEWELMLNAKPGTSFYFDWITPLPELKQCVVYWKMAVSFIDDETEYDGAVIHEKRIPPTSGDAIHLKDIKLLHYIFIDPGRFFSKHRWYKCVEYIEFGKRPWDICLTYQDTEIKAYDSPITSMDDNWLTGYEWLNHYRGNEIYKEKYYWYDEETLNYFDKYGVGRFRKLNIWDNDWNLKAQMLGRMGDYSDPRSGYEVLIHRFIEKYREDLKLKQDLQFKAIRFLGKSVLRLFGW